MTTLRDLRIEKGYTLEQLAELLGVTPGAISHWENGLRTPGVIYFPKMAQALGVPIEELVNMFANGAA